MSLFNKVALTQFEAYIDQTQGSNRRGKGLMRKSREINNFLNSASGSFESSALRDEESPLKRFSVTGQELHMAEEQLRGVMSPQAMAKVIVKRRGASTRMRAQLLGNETEGSLCSGEGSPGMDEYLSHGGMLDETDPKRFEFLKRGSFKKMQRTPSRYN